MYKIHSEELTYQANSEELFDSVRDLPEAIWLDSGKPRSLQGRFDIITACPESIIESKNQQNLITSNGQTQSASNNSFNNAKQLLNKIQPIEALPDVPFVCGLVGYFGYDLGRKTESISSDNERATQLPDLRLGLYLWSLVVDHELRKTTLYFHSNCDNSIIKMIHSRLTEGLSKHVNDEGFKLNRAFQSTAI